MNSDKKAKVNKSSKAELSARNFSLNQRALDRAHARRKRRMRGRVLAALALFLAVLAIIGFMKKSDPLNTPIGELFEDTGIIPTEDERQGIDVKNGVTYYTGDYPESEHLTLSLKGSDVTLVKQGDPYVEPGASAIDDRTGALSRCVIDGSVNTTAPGEYTVTYTFESDQAKASIERTVKVVSAEEFVPNEHGVPVLMYHYVYTDSDIPDELNDNWILDSDLEEQLKYLTENEYYFPSMSELRAYIDRRISLPEKSVILTFDDAQLGLYDYGVPLLEKYKVPAISFVIGKEEGAPDGLTKIKERTSRYLVYESHSYDMHKGGGYEGHGGIISAMEIDEIEEDLRKGIELTGSSDAFAYPFGDVTDYAQRAIRNVAIKCAFTTEYGSVQVGSDYTVLPRIRVLGDTGLDGFLTALNG